MSRVVVLGAGLTGCGTALELARRGVAVTLIDQDELPMNRASLRNEGKIHLGLIYAKDASLVTATGQLDGALRFRALLARWIGCAADRLAVSTPFVYVVANDSIVSPADLEAHYAAVDGMCRERFAGDRRLDYLGSRPESLFRRRAAQELDPAFDARLIQAGFETAELAIDTDELAGLLRQAVSRSPLIRFLPRHRVEAVERRAAGALRVEGGSAQTSWWIDADHVVNALWDDRRRIDQTYGLLPDPGWVYRLKFRVIVRLPDQRRALPSATMVLGRYGDVVIRPNGTAYLSWYPLGLRGWTHALATPPDWNDACRGAVGAADFEFLGTQTLAAVAAWYRGIGDARPVRVDAGVIVAYGDSDVDDTRSALHDRSRFGVNSHDGYHSVEPAKLTTAPVVAKAVADRIAGMEAGA